jgi:hypothetical protein
MADAKMTVPKEIESHPAWIRLNDQLRWYSQKSGNYKNWYTRLRIFQTGLAVLIPVASHLDPETAKWATSLAGALIATLEGIQQINQYSTLWVTYRSAAESLKQQKFLFLSSAGPYAIPSIEERLVMLAERVEEVVSTEHSGWIVKVKQSTKEQKGKNA